VWNVAYDPADGLVSLTLSGEVHLEEMAEFATAHADCLEATGGANFHMRIDLSDLFPLGEPELMLLSDVKRVAASQPGCRRIRVLASSPTVALQQRHSASGHVDESVVLESRVRAAQ